MLYNISYTNTMIIYCHSIVITKEMLLYNTERRYDHGMAVNYSGKKFNNIAALVLLPQRHYQFEHSLGKLDNFYNVQFFSFVMERPSLQKELIISSQSYKKPFILFPLFKDRQFYSFNEKNILL